MKRCLIVFDFDTKLIQEELPHCYTDINHVMCRHHFTNIHDMVYLSEKGISQAHGAIVLQELAIQYPWFEKIVSNVHFYEINNELNAHFIINNVKKARESFKHGLNLLRKQLIEAGLADEKIEEIIMNQQFSIYNVAQESFSQSI